MARTFATIAILLTLAPSAAFAQHRAGDAALGALSGAVVLGPVGAVAGAVIGYSAGPSIAHSWGLRGSRSGRDRRHTSKDANRAAPESRASADRMDSNARLTPAPGSENDSAQAAKPAPVLTGTPPVQTLE